MGRKRAMALGRVSVPAPAIWSCSITQRVAGSLTGWRAMLGFRSERDLGLAARAAEIDGDLASGQFGDLAGRRGRQEGDPRDRAELLAELVQGRDAALPEPPALDLRLEPGGERADQQGDREHHAERHDVLGVGHGERVPGRRRSRSRRPGRPGRSRRSRDPVHRAPPRATRRRGTP